MTNFKIKLLSSLIIISILAIVTLANIDYEYFGYFLKNKKIEEINSAPTLPITEFKPTINKKEVIFDPTRMSSEGYLKAKWGMTRQEVADSTGATLVEDLIINKEKFPPLASLETSVAGEKAIIVFHFINDRLHTVRVNIKYETLSFDNYIRLFSKFNNLLIDKYGKPVKKYKKGSKNPYISDGMAIATGEGGYMNEWETPGSLILLALSGDNYKIRLDIDYYSKKYQSLVEEGEKKRHKGKL